MMRRIIKWGGSLLSQPGICPRIEGLCFRLQAATNIIVVGGGPLVEQIRLRQHEESLSDETCHWLSIAAMSVTARQVHSWLQDSELIDSLQTLSSREFRKPVVFDCAKWLKRRTDLPRSWDFTSDSIGAALAHEVAADELILLKSCLPQSDVTTLSQLSESAFTDADFSHRAAGLPKIRIIDLRGGTGEVVLVDGNIQATLR